MRILVAIDGSEHSEAAVDEVAHWHYPADSEVRVISVIEPSHFPTTYPLGGVDMSVNDQMAKMRVRRSKRRQRNSVQLTRAANSMSRPTSSQARQSEWSSKRPKRSALI